MDDLMEPFLSPSSWSDLNTSSSSSWSGTMASQGNAVLSDSVDGYGGDTKNTPASMITSTPIIRTGASEDLVLHAHSDNSSVFGDENLKYLSLHELPSHNSLPFQNHNENHESNFLLRDVSESTTAGSYVRELNTSCSELSHNAITMSSSIESNGSDASKFGQSLGETNSISSAPAMWPSAYSGVSSFVENGKVQGFGFQGVESDADAMGLTYVENDKYSHLNNSAPATLHDCSGLHSQNLSNFRQQMTLTNGGLHPHHQEQTELHKLHFPSLSAGAQMTLSKSHGIQVGRQLSPPIEGNAVKHQTNHSSAVKLQAAPANTNASNGAAKPRVRARRGQATDPHSIAERLRREKIADRMKNLQELVPNSNKTDKASMLDEIIDYVKFLQLQVKVLSMSRLGAAGAVVPLITDAQAEGSGLLHLSSRGQGVANLCEAQDDLAFEQEVVKLLESNITTAMQYLQNKGLCLMPIALASAISTQKGTAAAAIPPERKKPDSGPDANCQSNGQSLAERVSCFNSGVLKQEDAVKSI